MSSFRDEDLRRVGRHGVLRLKFARRGAQTVLAEAFSKMPMQALPPFYFPETDCAHLYLVNPTGGLAGGDRIEIDLTLEGGVHVLAATPSATKIYKSGGDFAFQEVKVVIKEGGTLEYMPGALIPFAQSRYRQKTTIHMEEHTAALFLDLFTTGRVARGEHLQFSAYESRLEVEYGKSLVLSERMRLSPQDTDYSRLGFFENRHAAASLYLLFDQPSLEKALIADLRRALKEMPEIVGGVSTLPATGVVSRLLGPSTRLLEKAVLKLWAVASEKILPPQSRSQLARLLTF